MLNDSSQYWKSTFDNINLCNCDRENIHDDVKEKDVLNERVNNREELSDSNNCIIII
jgi:hypothetical protein